MVNYGKPPANFARISFILCCAINLLSEVYSMAPAPLRYKPPMMRGVVNNKSNQIHLRWESEWFTNFRCHTPYHSFEWGHGTYHLWCLFWKATRILRSSNRMQTAANMAEDLRPKIEENGSPPDRTVSMRATFANLRQSGHINWFKQGNVFFQNKSKLVGGFNPSEKY